MNNEYVSISYILSNGERFYRSYVLPYDYEKTNPIIVKIVEMERDVDTYLTSTFCENYEDITEFYSGWIEAPYLNSDESVEKTDDVNYSYETKDIKKEQLKELYEAIVADAKAGKLLPYNTFGSYSIMAYKYSDAYLYIEFENPNPNAVYYYEDYEYREQYSFWGNTPIRYSIEESSRSSDRICFGPDCENIINKLIEFGIIESVDEIYWGEY